MTKDLIDKLVNDSIELNELIIQVAENSSEALTLKGSEKAREIIETLGVLNYLSKSTDGPVAEAAIEEELGQELLENIEEEDTAPEMTMEESMTTPTETPAVEVIAEDVVVETEVTPETPVLEAALEIEEGPSFGQLNFDMSGDVEQEAPTLFSEPVAEVEEEVAAEPEVVATIEETPEVVAVEEIQMEATEAIVEEVESETVIESDTVIETEVEMTPTGADLNDIFGVDAIVLDQLQTARIESLKDAIGLNDKFKYIKDLFRGNANVYNAVVEQLDKIEDYETAKQFITEDVRAEYDWSNENETVAEFVDLMKRKYASNA